jgi:hypothetical protein
MQFQLIPSGGILFMLAVVQIKCLKEIKLLADILNQALSPIVTGNLKTKLRIANFPSWNSVLVYSTLSLFTKVFDGKEAMLQATSYSL